MKLADIVDIIIPHSIKKVMEGDEVLVIHQGNFSKSGFTITGQKIDNIANTALQDKEYLLNEFDILLSRYGEPFKVAIVGRIAKPILASEHLFVLRIKKTENFKEIAIALYMYLKSDRGQLELSKLVSPSGLRKLINKKNLLDLELSNLYENMTKANEYFYKEQELYDEIHKSFDDKDALEDLGTCKMCKKTPATHLRVDTWQPLKRGIPMCDECSRNILF
jgi:hypothetical protein